MTVKIKKSRLIYLGLFILLFVCELLIAKFYFSDFVRSYLGDVLVVILLWSFVRIFIPDKIALLPLWVFIFACLIETGQYFNYTELLGVSDNPLLCTLMGTSFAWGDILSYLAGCAVCGIVEIGRYKRNNSI
ncbi:MAG TPA: DUF2809 domain-containing protein [Ruminococcaceae bacterium]|nr:DUF2809 domain-containing protein [Oscillospiraceae bacterium]HAY73615.1 DUF2809 domain-containing protein [Oscillospiraceae bacterium]